MSAQHTPGPWDVLHGVLKGDHILIRGDGDYAVAKVYDQECGMEHVNDANARLIAAAPDYDAAATLALPILEADRQAFFDCHTVGKDINTLSEGERAILDAYDAAIEGLRAAQAKAKGEEE